MATNSRTERGPISKRDVYLFILKLKREMIPQDTRVEMICEKGMVNLEKMHTSGILLATPLKIMTKAELADTTFNTRGNNGKPATRHV